MLGKLGYDRHAKVGLTADFFNWSIDDTSFGQTTSHTILQGQEVFSLARAVVHLNS